MKLILWLTVRSGDLSLCSLGSSHFSDFSWDEEHMWWDTEIKVVLDTFLFDSW